MGITTPGMSHFPGGQVTDTHINPHTDKNFIENTFHNVFWGTEIQGSHTQKINTYFLISHN